MPSLTPEARRALAGYLNFQREMGVERMRFPTGGITAAPPAAAAAPPGATGESLGDIQTDLGADCRRCKLAQGRHSIVFGSGNPQAELVFVGEGPGADEDAQGLPFVGRGGQLLTDMIEKGMKLRR
ncbi:MAG TPA: uracil-DNA glycosylase family protein, partial [Terriglobales bacterium]|nr:uracil-DNA glycosylase family protein [Terriglobales bacterium]